MPDTVTTAHRPETCHRNSKTICRGKLENSKFAALRAAEGRGTGEFGEGQSGNMKDNPATNQGRSGPPGSSDSKQLPEEVSTTSGRMRGMKLIHEKHREIPIPKDQQTDRSAKGPGEKRRRFAPFFRDSRLVSVDLPPEKAFAPIRRIGGATGWYYADWLWRLRGWMDSMVGGEGLRRGRRDPDQLEVGDPVDCWRVIAYEPARLLLLDLEMKMPGRGRLEFEVSANGSGSTIRLSATYDASSLLGCLYWYLTYPLHELLLTGMLRGICEAAHASAAAGGSTGRKGS